MDLKGSVIDCHAHCGIQDRSFDQSFESYYSCVERTQIEGVVMFSPVIEIYDRYDPFFKDTLHYLGGLNGGYKAIADHGLWERPHVYTDTSLASSFEISDYINRYGHERIMFGSDFPFGDPESELIKIQRMNLKQHEKEAIVGKNIKRLLSDSNV